MSCFWFICSDRTSSSRAGTSIIIDRAAHYSFFLRLRPEQTSEKKRNKSNWLFIYFRSRLNMYGLLEDRCLDDVVSRAEQARLSYSLQHEEFRSLNGNLQVYLTDMKRIEDENRQLEGVIEQIRNDYILTLEQHLKRLPNDFRQESQTLNNAHLERYRSKSRARRHLNERDETKKRIQFLVSQEKESSKRCNQLQKQERSMNNEMTKLNEQMQHLLRYVDNEKQTHRQAMEKVDQLQLQLEQACVQRSKTEVIDVSLFRSRLRSLSSSKSKP